MTERACFRFIAHWKPGVVSWLLIALLAGIAQGVAAQDFTLRRQLSAVASGEGAPNGLFGWDVAVDGGIAVACDVRLDGSPSRLRTWRRDGESWRRLPGHDVALYGDSGCRMALAEGTLAITGFRSAAPSRGSIQILRYAEDGWTQEYSATNSSHFYDTVASNGGIVVAGVPLYDGAGGQGSGRIVIWRRSNNGTWSSSGGIINPPVAQAGQWFGQSVAIVAGAVAVGAPGLAVNSGGSLRMKAGAAYVYELTIDTWSLVASLTEPNGQINTGHRFGSAVAISGTDPAVPDRLLVSRPANAVEGHAGVVRAYRRGGSTWESAFSLQQDGAPTTDQFGCSLAMDGEWAVVGACSSNSAATSAGAILVVRFNEAFDGVWLRAERTDPAAAVDDYLGVRTGIDRDGPTVIVGNLAADLYGNRDQGVVLTSVGNGSIPSVLRRSMDLGQGLTGARAAMIAADGDLLVIGAPGEDVGFQHERGAAYVYRRGAGGFALEQRLLAPDGMAGDGFGSAIALQGDRLLVSATGRPAEGEPRAGAVYVFRRASGTWSLEAQWVPQNPGYETVFGFTLALDGNTAMVGEFGEKTSVYERSAGGTWSRVQELPHRAWALRLRGDLAFLGDPNATGGAGGVAIHRRQGDTWMLQTTLSGGAAGQGLGRGVDGDGDVLAIASSTPATPVLLYRRSGNAWLPEASLLPDDVTAGIYCQRVAFRGDTLALGCQGGGNEGEVYVFGKTNGLWQQTQRLALSPPRASDAFGSTLALDGGWLFAGALGRDLDFLNQGAVYAYASDRIFRSGFE